MYGILLHQLIWRRLYMIIMQIMWTKEGCNWTSEHLDRKDSNEIGEARNHCVEVSEGLCVQSKSKQYYRRCESIRRTSCLKENHFIKSFQGTTHLDQNICPLTAPSLGSNCWHPSAQGCIRLHHCICLVGYVLPFYRFHQCWNHLVL